MQHIERGWKILKKSRNINIGNILKYRQLFNVDQTSESWPHFKIITTFQEIDNHRPDSEKKHVLPSTFINFHSLSSISTNFHQLSPIFVHFQPLLFSFVHVHPHSIDTDTTLVVKCLKSFSFWDLLYNLLRFQLHCKLI